MPVLAALMLALAGYAMDVIATLADSLSWLRWASPFSWATADDPIRNGVPAQYVLLVAAIVSGALLQEWIDAGVILAIVFLNAVIGYAGLVLKGTSGPITDAQRADLELIEANLVGARDYFALDGHCRASEAQQCERHYLDSVHELYPDP